MKFICPLIAVSNMEISKRFYTEILGQKVKYDFGENVTFEGDFSIHLDTHFSTLINNKPIVQGGNNFELYFEQNNLDQFVEKLAALNVSLIHPLMEHPWRQKAIRFYDPDKHIIEVGESMEYTCYRLSLEGLNESEIQKFTTMPLEFVRNSIQHKR
ncbi:MAG: VOC family protein [Prolixibacteraceae bacterium]|nr:VOC family protein [Prolixibacteraceae bacterium]